MAYKPPVQSIVDNETSSLPSSEAVFEALKDKADVDLQNITLAGFDGDVLTLDNGLPVWSAPAGGSSLPSQTGNSGKFLTTNGSSASWEFVEKVATLTDAATIEIDASLGSVFTVTLGGNRTLGAPTNSTNGQKIIIRVTQDNVGGRVLSYDSIWVFGQDLLGVSNSLSANGVDYIGAIYSSASTKWHVIAFARGY